VIILLSGPQIKVETAEATSVGSEHELRKKAPIQGKDVLNILSGNIDFR
jgi:hypothetical protein